MHEMGANIVTLEALEGEEGRLAAGTGLMPGQAGLLAASGDNTSFCSCSCYQARRNSVRRKAEVRKRDTIFLEGLSMHIPDPL